MLYIFQYDFSVKHVLLIICIIGGIASVAYAMYSIYCYLSEYSIVSGKIKGTYERLCEANKSREKRNIAAMIERGNEEDKSIIGRVDRMITYSGITRKIKWLNTEVFITIDIIVILVTTVAVAVIARSITVGFTVTVSTQMIVAIVLMYTANTNYIKVEDSLPQFMWCVENFSTTGNDLIEILDKSSRYIDPTIGVAVQRCVAEAKNSGNVMAAMTRLENTFENKYWKLIIRNLSICSRYDCSYSDIMSQLKDVTEEYIAYEKEKRQEYKNNRLMIYAMIAIGVFAMTFVSKITEMTLIEVFIKSKIVMLLTVIGLVAVIYIAVIKGMRH